MRKYLKTTLYLLICLLLFAENGFADWQTIWNGHTWHDVDGNPIHAHGAGILKVGDTYYLFGEDKSHNSHHFLAVNCYSSPDLVNWTFRNAVLTKETHTDLNQTGRVIERPKVTYNESTGEFVMWMHWESSNYGVAECGIAKCATVDGDYELVDHFRPNNNMSRDCTLFKDDDGAAYFVSAANENADLIIYELTDDYLDIQRQVITLWRGQWREAPALIKKDGTYYLITSGATGWDPNQARYGTAASMEGPWTNLKYIGNGTTFDSQSTYVLPVDGPEDTTYIFCADRWQDPDLQSSKYIWLNLELGDNTASLSWNETWQVNVSTGANGQGEGVVPVKPENFSGESVSFTQVELTWEDRSDNEAGFEIERVRENSSKVINIGVNGNRVLDTGLLPGQAYTYRIKAVNGAGESDYSPDLFIDTNSEISDSLVGYYKFNSGTGSRVIDSSAYNHNGALKYSPQWVDGYEGSGLEFNGSNSYVDLGTNEIFDLQEAVTLSAWIKQYDAANGEHNPWITKGDHTFGLKHYDGNSYQFFIYDDGWYSVNSPSAAGDNNEWHHFIGTFDGSELKLYMDGELKNSLLHAGYINIDSGSRLNIARNSENTDRLFEGVLDEIKIFNIALNENQAEQLYYDSVTDIYPTDEVIHAKEFSLHQNYPNPFNPSTTIKYSIPVSSKQYQESSIQPASRTGRHQVSVTLKVYNLLGQHVATLVNSQQRPGTYKVKFDASSLPTGTYIYRIVTNKNTISKKMTLIK